MSSRLRLLIVFLVIVAIIAGVAMMVPEFAHWLGVIGVIALAVVIIWGWMTS